MFNRKISVWHTIFSFILKHAVGVVVIYAIIIAAAVSVLPKIKIDNSVEVFFDKQSPSYINLQEWKDQFGTDDLIIVAFRVDDVFTRENLTLISDLTEEFKGVAYVDEVTSLTTVNTIVGHEQDFIVERLIERIPSDGQQLSVLKQETLRDPLYVKNVVSADGRTTALLLEISNEVHADDTRLKEVIDRIQGVMKDRFPAGMKYYMSGLKTIEYYFAWYMQNDLKAFMPFMFIMIALVLFLNFRYARTVILILLGITISMILTMACFYFLGYSLNNVTTLIPPILMAIMIAESIHLVQETLQLKKERGSVTDQEDSALILSSLTRVFFPCFLTTLTTADGFLSLSVSRIPPIKQLGLVVGFAGFIALIVSFTFLPALMKLMHVLRFTGGSPETFEGRANVWLRLRQKYEHGFDAFLTGLCRFIEKRKIGILIGAGVLTVVSFWGMTQIKVESSVLEYFRKSSPVYRSTIFVEEHLSGVHTLNISLKADREDYFKDPQALRAIEELTSFLMTLPQVDKVTSVLDYLKEINKSFHNEDPAYYVIPDDADLVSQYVLLYGQDDMDDFVDSPWKWATVRVRLTEHSTMKLQSIITDVQAYLDAHPLSDVVSDVVGQTVLEAETNNNVTEGQIQSLATAMITIFGMMFLVFRSIPVGIISIYPNMLPILLNFSVMAALGIRLDSATSMIAAMGIGIVVDDTIHFLYDYGENVKKHGDYTKAMYHSLEEKGRPIIYTSLILFFGFGILSISQFMPTSYFGMLSALLMATAVLGDLIFLPAMLIVFKPKFHYSKKPVEEKG